MSKSIYLIQGDSLFRAQRMTSLLARLDKSRGPLETETIRVLETPFEDVFSKIRSKPFFAKTQIFIFPEASDLKSKDFELLEDYLQKPADFSVLIFEWEEAQEKYRNARASEGLNQLTALIKSAGGEVETAPAGGKASLGTYIREKINAAGKTMDSSLLQRMESEWQDFPSLLESALENMIVSAGSNLQITEAMVAAFEDNLSKGDRFKLLEAVLAKNARESLNAFSRLLETGDDDPIGLISFFHSQFRLYWQARRLLERGMTESEIFKKLGISAGRGYFFKKQMRVFNTVQLDKALERLFELDRSVKTGEGESEIGLERWIIQVCDSK